MTQLWRGETLTDRGRSQEDSTTEDADADSEVAQDGDRDGGQDRSGQTNLQQW